LKKFGNPNARFLQCLVVGLAYTLTGTIALKIICAID